MSNKYALQITDAEYVIKQMPADACNPDHAGKWVFIDCTKTLISRPFNTHLECVAALAMRLQAGN